jgi:membrane protein implicated in regulation of membrane protease activity
MMSASLPVAALVVIGILLVVLGLFAPAIQLLYVGIGAIIVGGVLQVLGQRRS